MFIYRALHHFEDWKKAESCSNLPLQALSDLISFKDNDLSLIQVGSDSETSIDRAAVKFYLRNTGKNFAFGLLPMNDQFVSKLNLCPKPEGTVTVDPYRHLNIANVTFSEFKQIVEYAFSCAKDGKLVVIGPARLRKAAMEVGYETVKAWYDEIKKQNPSGPKTFEKALMGLKMNPGSFARKQGFN